ncbi:hypothetical protein PMAYCL1PPCAC_13393 [Pristionchus mayeri]|uniref:CWH43-like N-terminal domain-containing protein n=1 Tax=Pristionchus mayeri TaxID=1317129 RepID=A0AAN4ZQZ5_9BILA|nr:hypothetical protein PMAYCL1PPCAC_13393 [Pristionchus mayeri]
MSEIRQLWLLPIVAFAVSIFGILAPSVIGGANGDLQWILPFISDGGAFAPEKNIFAMLQNISAGLIAIMIYIKHLQFVTFYGNRRSDSFWRSLSIISMLLGFIAAFGLSLVGDFSEKDVPNAHNTAAFIAFGGATAYIILSAGLSFLQPLLCSTPVAWLRVALAIAVTIALAFHTVVLDQFLFIPPGTNTTGYTGDNEPVFLDRDSPFFIHHTIATGSEWVLAFLIFAYFITLVEEFRKCSLTLPSVNFHADQLLPIEKRPSEEDRWRN